MTPFPIRRLDELSAPLDRALLHVFVVGPGKGEAVAVALPNRGWLVLDGAVADLDPPPILEILARWKTKEEHLDWALLSHPHDDHVDGLADVLNVHPPQAIGLAGADDAPRYVDILKDAQLPDAREEALKAKKVRMTFSAIRTWERTNRPARGVHRGMELLNRADVRLRVLGPSKDAIAAYLSRCAADPELLKREANRYSLVLDLKFGEARILLPGDLPRTLGGTAIQPGWDELVSVAPEVGDHSLLKVPHHGSAEAIHPDVMSAGPPNRAWVITPYNSARVPRVADADGLPAIVAKGRPVFLSALPLSKSLQAVDHDGVISLDQIASRIALQAGPNPFKDSRDVEVTPGSARGPLDCVWAFAVNASGAIAAAYRGPAALSIRVPSVAGATQ